MEALRVGLAGAGPWASTVHGPLLAAGPHTALTGVWSRTHASATRLADRLGSPAFERYQDLVEASDAIALAVAPEAQPELAVAAAEAGRALLLEKPLALDIEGATRIVEAIEGAGVGSSLMLTYRFVPGVRQFVGAAEGWTAHGGRGSFLSGAFLGGPFAASPWRQQLGCLLDVGPHLLDLAAAALGPIMAMRGAGDVQRSVSLLLEHASGAVSDLALSCRAAFEPSRTEFQLWGPEPPGLRTVDAREGLGPEAFAALLEAFVDAARRLTGATVDGRPVDARRGLELQRLIAMAEDSLRR